MIYITIGAFAFIAFVGFDLASLHDKCKCKYLFGLSGLILLGYSTFEIISINETVEINNTINMVSYIISLIFLALLVYSVFVEVGKNTYEYNAKPSLVTDGTYSLVRHPGVIWFFFAYLFFALALESQMLLHACIVWSLVNGLYTYLQEKYILYNLFHDYNEYQKTTPMFIPNITSIKKFIAHENWRKR